jgi:hypothetical protein
MQIRGRSGSILGANQHILIVDIQQTTQKMKNEVFWSRAAEVSSLQLVAIENADLAQIHAKFRDYSAEEFISADPAERQRFGR